MLVTRAGSAPRGCFMSKKENIEKGRLGEEAAVAYLKKKRYKILDINFRCKIGEIDIVARDKSTIVFVEVKSRQSRQYGYPSQAVNYYKQRKVSKVALYYLQNKKLFNYDYNVRFDVVEILEYLQDMKVNHIVNAFELTL